MGTEDMNYRTKNIDKFNTKEIVETIHLEDIKAYEAIGCVINDIADTIDAIMERLEKGGRVIYVGAGTSGRVAAQDVIELMPTYGLGEETFIYFIAGGDEALKVSKEGAEDNEKEILDNLTKIGLNENDSVLGVSASGNTPYVLSALKFARERGSLSIGITNNKNSRINLFSDKLIILDTGPEVIQGSTRMKAGTAQKMLLNIISTTIAIKLGRVEGNLMTHMKAYYNQKLKKRAVSIIINRFGLSEAEAKELLEKENYDLQKVIHDLSNPNSKGPIN